MPRALIVEDEIVIAMDLGELLEDWGWSVLGPVHNCEHGVRLARRERPDVAIVDVKLLKGHASGIDVAAVLHGELGVPVIYMSGLRGDHLEYTARFTHPCGMIRKPIDPAALRRTLEEALGEADAEIAEA